MSDSTEPKDPFVVDLEELIAKHGLDHDLGIPKDILALSMWEELQVLGKLKGLS